MQRSAFLIVTLAVACSRKTRVDETPVRRDPALASASVAKDAGTPEIPVDFGSPGPVVIAPKVPPFDLGMMDHASDFGWSKDGTLFGYCQTDGGLGATHCGLWPRVGKPELFNDIDASRSDVDPKKSAAIGARLKALALSSAPVPWAFARDLELTWMVIEGDAAATPPRLGVLKVGARVKGEKPSYAVALSETSMPYFDRIHPEVIALSPDGKLLGVIAHAFAGEFSDSFEVALIPASKLAAQAYNDAGYDHHQKKEYAVSADYFRKVVAADPTHVLAPYNLACAYARLGDSRAEAALKEAIDRGLGADVKKRARDDDDFASVKSQGWFVALVGS